MSTTSLRLSQERGHFNHDWLDSYHSFSFGSYYDHQHMGVSVLRVINEDRVAPGAGFPTHPHQNMEIVSYVLEGALAHKDSLGNGSTIRPGDVQRMSAGTGVRHSEYNPQAEQAAHFLQIWLLPNQHNIAPSYAQQHFSVADKTDRWCLVVSPDGREHSLSANTEALLYASILSEGKSLSYQATPERELYLHVATGKLAVNGSILSNGDAMRLSAGAHLQLEGIAANSEVLLFDLPVL